MLELIAYLFLIVPLLIFGFIGFAIFTAIRRVKKFTKKIDHGFGQIQKIVHNKNQQVVEEIWLLNNRRHRHNDLPAVIYYYDNGQVEEEKYYINGYQHRDDDKPAEIEYNRSGQIVEQEWYINGRKIREEHYY